MSSSRCGSNQSILSKSANSNLLGQVRRFANIKPLVSDSYFGSTFSTDRKQHSLIFSNFFHASLPNHLLKS